MRRVRPVLWLMLASLAIVLPSCVVLCGQRICLRYDAAADRLDMLVFYDGIHDDELNSAGGDAAEALGKFVANGDIMILDWIGHIQMAQLTQSANDANTPAAVREFCKVVLGSVKTQSIGHYRDLDGRIGAAQMVTIDKASVFIDKANAAINETLGAELNNLNPADPWYRSQLLMRKACANGHKWIALDGNAIRVTVPMDYREWTMAKAKFVQDELTDLINDAAREDGKAQALKSLRDFMPVVQMASAAPMSIVEAKDKVTFTLGEPSSPTVLRGRLTDRTYNDRLEKTVISNVTKNLDEQLAARVTGGHADKAQPAIDAIVEWGPPEAAARILARKAVSGNVNAVKQLAAWREKWNREVGVPVAPAVDPSDGAVFIDAWTHWYDQMTHFPLPVPKPAGPADAPAAKTAP